MGDWCRGTFICVYPFLPATIISLKKLRSDSHFEVLNRSWNLEQSYRPNGGRAICGSTAWWTFGNDGSHGERRYWGFLAFGGLGLWWAWALAGLAFVTICLACEVTVLLIKTPSIIYWICPIKTQKRLHRLLPRTARRVKPSAWVLTTSTSTRCWSKSTPTPVSPRRLPRSQERPPRLLPMMARNANISRHKESYAIYIYKVLKQVHPDTGVSS